ncbi:hypothetical protein QSU92_07795 [Microbacterium sp. ET2]|uniref:hypothetical protein n=1 Tax=Microbacterium albipurpureum TaxID=3050384 RepID=UPI00259D1094|nr:hypothetical protein [Microbacterium sp. ET2 (Ac-2212)]WJL97056.1 hypothetical protein QSU92_07795 [Microbacterium sp. ET2 (Ac-2212)]
MIDRADVEELIFRVAECAFRYHPSRSATEPGYTVEEDVAWCVEPLSSKEGVDAEALARRIQLLITNPTADRRAFIEEWESRSQ